MISDDDDDDDDKRMRMGGCLCMRCVRFAVFNFMLTLLARVNIYEFYVGN